MSYNENNFINENENNFEEGFNNDDNYYYLTENEQSLLNDNIYDEDNYVEHMDPSGRFAMQEPHMQQNLQPHMPVNQPLSQPKQKKSKINWLYVFLIIILIAIVIYYLIDRKYITVPSFRPSSTYSPSSSSFKNTLGSTFMSLH